MSGWSPPPDDLGGSPGNPRSDPEPGHGGGDGTGSAGRPDTGAGGSIEPGSRNEPGNATVVGPDTAAGHETAAGPGAAPGHVTAPGSGTAPAAAPPPDYAPPPGPGPPPGDPVAPVYSPPPAAAAPPVYGPPPGPGPPPGRGYAQPGPGGMYPGPPIRRRWRIWLGIVAGFVVLAIVIAGISVYILNKSPNWTLTAPQTIAGMSRDARPADQLAFGALVAKFKSNVTSLPRYGTLKSTVSGIYALGSGQAVGFIGFNGAFNVRVALKTGAGIKVSSANPGPHGGTAECGSGSSYAVCQWSTATTVGIVLVIPASSGASHESLASANDLMIRIRDSVERPAHRS
jgi:hypothetical protein